MNDHEHRYFIFKTYDSYEPVVDIDLEATGKQGKFYQKIEYAVLGCNCGSVIKMKVKE
jgi:hypothetical protein